MAARADGPSQDPGVIAAAGGELDDAHPGADPSESKDFGRMAAGIARRIFGRPGRIGDRGADRGGWLGIALTLCRGGEREGGGERNGEMEFLHVSPPSE